uniref:Putative homing endonuclease n=1 Tax=Bacillus subtilis TaxID=1423 RepID=Q5DVN1_BACIU|nr:putative homing endonuclease [Bacillus subtilis]
MKKKLIIGALALGLIPTIGNTTVSAKPLQNPVKVVNPLADARCKGGGTLICETGNFTAKGTFFFDYYGSEDDKIRVYIANDGSYPFEYRITNPDGKRIADGITVKPGKSTESTFYAKDIEGTYKVRVTNDDGEDIKAFVKARGL